MPIPRSLMQRSRVRMAADRIKPIRIFSNIQHQSHDLGMTILRGQSESQMTLIRAGPREKSPSIFQIPKRRG